MFATLLSACGIRPACRNEPLGRVASEDGRYDAVIFARDCGATTGRNLHVSVVRKGRAADGQGNALVVDHMPAGADALRPEWRNGRLTLSVPSEARVFTRRTQVGDVAIRYR